MATHTHTYSTVPDACDLKKKRNLMNGVRDPLEGHDSLAMSSLAFQDWYTLLVFYIVKGHILL